MGQRHSAESRNIKLEERGQNLKLTVNTQIMNHDQ